MSTFNRLVQAGVAFGLAASLHPSTANADSAGKSANPELASAVKHTRQIGKIASEGILHDAQAEVKRDKKRLKNIKGGGVHDVLLTVDELQEGEFKTLVSVDGDTGQVTLAETTATDIVSSQIQNSRIVTWETNTDIIGEKLDAGKKINLKLIEKALVGGAVKSVEVVTDEYKPGTYEAVFLNGMHTTITRGRMDQANPFDPATVNSLNGFIDDLAQVNAVFEHAQA